MPGFFKKSSNKISMASANQHENKKSNEQKPSPLPVKSDSELSKLSKELEKNVEMIENIFKDDDTLIVRPGENRHNNNLKFCLFSINGMTSNEMINESIIKPLLLTDILQEDSGNIIDVVHKQVLFSNEVENSDDLTKIISSVLYGDSILFINGYESALIINSKGFKTRSIEEPESDRTLRGPREGFNESLMTNAALLRRKLKTSDLKFKMRTFGARTNTSAFVCYLDSLVDKKMLSEFNDRLDKIDIDGVLDVNYISEMIKDNNLSPFKTTGVTERPDVIAANLLEGRIALILDGTPSVVSVPYLFIENFQSSDDYYINYYFTSFGRILRMIGFLISIFVPAIYIALVAFHREMIPANLALSIAKARQDVPLPTVVECVLMLIIFDLIRETGVRMPSNVGQALSVVAALVIGQSAVEAKFVSAPMIIIVAISAITELLNTNLKEATVLVRLIFILGASILGFYGLFFATLFFIIHLYSIYSFGTEYTSQLISLNPQDLKDIYIRSPWWKMKTRPKFVKTDKIRAKQNESGL